MKASCPVVFLTLLSLVSIAQQKAIVKGKQFSARPLSIMENRGQVRDQYGNERKDIQYKANGNGVSVFIGNGQLHYQFHKALNPGSLKKKGMLHDGKMDLPDTTPTQYQMYRLDMALENANPHATAIATEKQAYYENYHTTALCTDSTKPVAAYNKVTYKNIYPHIDWVLYIKNNTLEYDFIINPGGNVNDIKIKYNGADAITHTDSNIHVLTPLGTVTERNLYAYNQATGEPIPATYTSKHNTLGFVLTTQHLPLTTIIIDPSLAWGTYFGGMGEDGAYAIACDNGGTELICGTTTSISNIATTGAYQTFDRGYYDVFLAKFNSPGVIQWSTYYGGPNHEEGYAVGCDHIGSIYITGWTVSSSYIATPGSHQTTYMGGWDAYLAKFSSAGALLWGTYYGGNSVEMGRGVVCDSNGNVYITGYTGSDSNIATMGSYQDTIGGHSGGDNAYLAKFNANGLLLLATYFGGGGDGSYAVACGIDKNQCLYIGGSAYHNGIFATAGDYKDNCNGLVDCFIAKFDSSCMPLWSTYYGGDSDEQVNGISCDDSLNVYITGISSSLNGIATSGAHQTVYGGYIYDAFLAKFNDTGALKWATYYGGEWDDEGNGVACDGLGNVYIVGYSQSPNNIATLGSYKDSNNNGNYDAFLAKFDCYSGALKWGTYYGGDLGDGAYGVACNKEGSIFIAGQTASSNGITTPGCYQYLFADSSDAFIAKFDTATTTAVHTISKALHNIQLFPNPNGGNFTVSGMVSGSRDEVMMEITDAAGRVLQKVHVPVKNNTFTRQVALNGAASGIYYVKVLVGSDCEVIKFTLE